MLQIWCIHLSDINCFEYKRNKNICMFYFCWRLFFLTTRFIYIYTHTYTQIFIVISSFQLLLRFRKLNLALWPPDAADWSDVKVQVCRPQPLNGTKERRSKNFVIITASQAPVLMSVLQTLTLSSFFQWLKQFSAASLPAGKPKGPRGRDAQLISTRRNSHVAIEDLRDVSESHIPDAGSAWQACLLGKRSSLWRLGHSFHGNSAKAVATPVSAWLPW